jgi:PAS domain S-box-containing protein
VGWRRDIEGAPVEVKVILTARPYARTICIVAVISHIDQHMRSHGIIRADRDSSLNFLEHSYDLLCTHDLDGRILTVNASAARILGYATDELVKMNVQDILVPEVRGKFLEYIENLRQVGFADGVMVVQTRSGERRAWEYHNTLQTAEVPAPVVWGIAHDITKIRQANKTLEEQKVRAQEYLDIAGTMILVVRPDQRVDVINRKGCEVLGYKKEEIIGKHWSNNFLPVRERDRANRAFAKLADGQSDPVEYVESPILKQDGEERLIAWHNAVIRDRSGQIIATLSSGEDITDRKRSEKALQASEAQFRDLAGSIPDIYFAIDHESRIIYWNKAAEELSCVAAKDILGKRGSMLFPEYLGTYPDQVLDEVLKTREARTIIHKYQLRDQEYVFESSANPTNSGVSVIARNITDRIKAEEALQAERAFTEALIDSLPGVVYILDQQGEVVRWNRNAETILGYAREELSNLATLDVVAEEDRALIASKLQEAFTRGSAKEEARVLTKDGRKIPFLLSTMRAVIGNKTYVVGTGIDITKRKRVEEELQTSRDQLRALTARLEKFREEERTLVARELHDQLGQGLTAIKIGVSNLTEYLPSHKKSQITAIQKLADETIESVRRISTQLRPPILDDAGLVATIEWAGHEFSARNGIKVQLDLPQEDLDIPLDSATGLFRIFQETLTNVARHANATKVNVRIAKEHGNLTLEVHDNGKGISTPGLPHSTPLGILGMQERALVLGGEFTIAGVPGKGTTVTVRIPMASQKQRELFK